MVVPRRHVKTGVPVLNEEHDVFIASTGHTELFLARRCQRDSHLAGGCINSTHWSHTVACIQAVGHSHRSGVVC